jgi:hypothetical protein
MTYGIFNTKRYPNPVVEYRLVLPPHRHFTLGREFDSIRQEVQQDLLDPKAISDDTRRVGFETTNEADFEILLLGGSGHGIKSGFHHVADREWCTFQRDG